MVLIFLLALIELILFSTNYTHGSFLMGWDNVMPEFNTLLNLKRSFFGVWANFRGLGFTNGMSEISNLVHTLYILLLSVFFGKSDLRYISIITLHLAGGIGFYLLTKKLINNSKASLIGALFYMFNIGVIQMFYAPLEAFVFHFAALPIGALLITNSLNKISGKNLLFLFLGGLFLSSQAFVPTVFIVFLLLLATLLLVNFIKEKNFKKILIVALVFLASNAYWLLPYLYSGPKAAPVVQNTRINQFASPEVYYRNKTYGGIKSVLMLKGFMLDTVEYDPIFGKNYNFMQVWLTHYNNLYYQLAFFLIILISGLGFSYCFFRKKSEFYPYILTLIIPFVFLANNAIFFEKFNNLLRSVFPLLGEVFRFPFTKFIIIFAFSFSIFLTIGIDILIERFKKWKMIVFSLMFIFVFLISFPAFTGHFFSPNLRLKLPTYYTQMFDYLNSQDENKRIALLPLDTFWNWRYNSWGDFGSGFVWYGIRQSVLTRAFDPWSNYNEEFYNELEYSINSQNTDLFKKTLSKYDISYLLLDESFINSLSRRPINYTSIENFIKLNKIITKEKQIGKLILYKINIDSPWVYALNRKETLKAYPTYLNENEDTIQRISNQNNYVVDSKNPDLVPIFPSLYAGKLQKNIEFKVEETKNSIILSSGNISLKPKDYVLRIPSLFSNDFLIPVKTSLQNGQIYIQASYPEILIDGKALEVRDEPIILTPKFIKNPKEIIFHDIKNQIVDLNSDNRESYLLSHSLNTIEIVDGAQNEILSFDTGNISPSVFFISLPNKPAGNIKLIFPKIKNVLSSESVLQSPTRAIKKIGPLVNCCESLEKLDFSKQNISIIAKNAQIDLSFYLDGLFHQGSYIIFIKTLYTSGLPINFYIDNPFQNRSELETKLATDLQNNIILLPKTENYFEGYGLHLTVRSVGSEIAKSSIDRIAFYPIPNYFIRGISLVNPNTSVSSQSKNLKYPLSFEKINDSLYEVYSPPKDNVYVTLSQSFDSGWKAYEMVNGKWQMANWIKKRLPFLFGKELKEHVLVNNWANGWLINSEKLKVKSEKFIIIYWPQYLEYLGFGVLIGTLVWLTISLKRKPKQQSSI